MEKHLQPFGDTSVSNGSEAIRHLREDIANGKHWYIALLEAIGQWTVAEESHNGRDYRYLIANEAFDWLLLAERLLAEIDHLIPEKEMLALLFHARAPIELPKEEFCQLIGEAKYRAHLNYFYGITVEEALLLAVEEEARKEQRARAFNENNSLWEEAYERIYGAPITELLGRFRKERGYPRRNSMKLVELKEFTYWLFKYRLNNSDKARIASDTKKALRELERQWGMGQRLRDSSGETTQV
ncbi:MAG TPA: hypothetical protein VMX96_01275 [Dehalococcoidia bacterium]|nr:hypothetical protein [Dehalococcoidia bacterium]